MSYLGHEERILNLLEQRKTVSQIARELGLSYSCVYNFKAKQNKRTKEEVGELPNESKQLKESEELVSEAPNEEVPKLPQEPASQDTAPSLFSVRLSVLVGKTASLAFAKKTNSLKDAMAVTQGMLKTLTEQEMFAHVRHERLNVSISIEKHVSNKAQDAESSGA